MSEATVAIISALSALAGVGLSQAITAVQDGRRQRHEREERRYEDKRSTYVNFALACNEAIRKAAEFDEHYGHLPGEAPEYSHLEGNESLNEHFDLIEIYAPEQVKQAAKDYRQSVDYWAFGNGKRADVNTARTRYMAEMHADLKLT